MINAWSLLYEELNGTMDETYPIKKNNMNEDITITSLESDEYDPKPKSDSDDTDWNDPVITVGSGNTASSSDGLNLNIDTSAFDYSVSLAEEFTMPEFTEPFVLPTPEGLNFSDTVSKPKPNLKDPSTRKYQEDRGIEDLKNYVTSTYQGHYTNENSDVQTLDLIHSVGDAESFCRSNALKYLSRYDKKGSAKQDILKAMHYCLLLYYFSGNTKETNYTNTRYETF